jgi:acyl-CoA thioester hydrolase
VTDDPGAFSPRLHIPIHLRWGDLDAFNHVNNASMLKLLEEVRVRAL